MDAGIIFICLLYIILHIQAVCHWTIFGQHYRLQLVRTKCKPSDEKKTHSGGFRSNIQFASTTGGHNRATCGDRRKTRCTVRPPYLPFSTRWPRELADLPNGCAWAFGKVFPFRRGRDEWPVERMEEGGGKHYASSTAGQSAPDAGRQGIMEYLVAWLRLYLIAAIGHSVDRLTTGWTTTDRKAVWTIYCRNLRHLRTIHWL